MDDQHFDELFRNDLEPDYDKFDEANWQEMESKLNGIAPKANPLPLMSIAQYATMVLILGIGAFAFWQISEGNKAIDTLSTEIEELKKAQQVETTTRLATPIVIDEPETIVYQEPKVTDKTSQSESVPVAKKEVAVAKVEVQQETIEPKVAEAKAEKEAVKENAQPSATPKYYMLVDGEFVPVAEFDHPGAEQGDSARGNESITSEASN